MQIEGIDKLEQEKTLEKKVSLVEEKFRKIDNFETIFLLTMITLVKKGSLKPDKGDSKIIDMQSSVLV
jgi:hypothetical protein